MNSWSRSVIARKSFRVCNELLSPLGSAARNQHFTHEWERHESRLSLIERLGGRLDCLFGGKSYVNPHEHLTPFWWTMSILRKWYRIIASLQKLSRCSTFFIRSVSDVWETQCHTVCSWGSQPETHGNNHTAEADKNRVCARRLCREMHVHLNLSIRYQTIRWVDCHFLCI